MLKKAPNSSLSIRYHLIDSNVQFNMVMPQHTLMKKIENELSKKMKINPFKI